MNDYQRKFRDYLRSQGFSATVQRMTVLDEVYSLNGHFDAEQLAARLRERGISRATVYRTLNLLLQADLIREVIYTEGHAHYESTLGKSRHEHLVCIRCGRVQEFSTSDIEKLLMEKARALGFSPTSHKVEVYGYCPRCLKHSGKRHQDR